LFLPKKILDDPPQPSSTSPQMGGGGDAVCSVEEMSGLGDGPSVIQGVGVAVGAVASGTKVSTLSVRMVREVSGVGVVFVMLVAGALPSGFGEIVRLI